MDWRSVVQAPPEVWRHVVSSGGADADKIAVAFEMSAARETRPCPAAERDAARRLLDVQEQAALKIQSSFRGHQARTSPDRKQGVVDDPRIEELRKSIRDLTSAAGGEERRSDATEPQRRARAKAEAALAAIQAGAGGEHQTRFSACSRRNRRKLGAISSLQQAQLAQVAALAGDDRTLSMVQAQQQQQLAQLATPMQAQLNQLAEAIGTLNRSTDNLNNLPDNNKSKSTRESLENNTDWASALALTTTNGGDDDAAAGRGADVDDAAATLVWPTTDEVPPRCPSRRLVRSSAAAWSAAPMLRLKRRRLRLAARPLRFGRVHASHSRETSRGRCGTRRYPPTSAARSGRAPRRRLEAQRSSARAARFAQGTPRHASRQRGHRSVSCVSQACGTQLHRVARGRVLHL